MGKRLGHFTNEGIQMVKKHIKRYSTPLVILKMQIKTTTRFLYLPSRMANSKRTDKTKYCQGRGTAGTLTPSWGNWKCCNHFGSFLLSTPLSTPTSRYSPKRKRNLCPHKALHVNVDSFITIAKLCK